MSAPPAKAQGIEIMLRSMGLGDVLDMSRKLASEGTVEKILAFANGLEALNAKLDTLIALSDRPDGDQAADRRDGRGDANCGGGSLAGPGPADLLAPGPIGAAAPRANGADR